MSTNTGGIVVSRDGHIGIVELSKGEHNYFDVPMITAIGDAVEALEAEASCRVILLCAAGKSFCAGANFSGAADSPPSLSARVINPIYSEALRIFACTKPIVVAVQGPAIGGGLGLALVGDFRVSCPEAKFSANFNRLGFHPGFGLSYTLPSLVGMQQAALMFYTGRRIDGSKALELGLVDELVPREEVREAAKALCREIATSSPRAVQSTRTTLRQNIVEEVRKAIARESAEQSWQMKAEDFREGVLAMSERREPRFKD